MCRGPKNLDISVPNENLTLFSRRFQVNILMSITIVYTM